MSLMGIRHKPITVIIWLTCLLTFYLGFNQQVMCFELTPDGKISKLHLQLIECNPLGNSPVSAGHSAGIAMPDGIGQMNHNGCPSCWDFHLSFKRKRGAGIDLAALVPFSISPEFDYPATSFNSLQPVFFNTAYRNWLLSPPVIKANSSLNALRTTILLI